MDNTVDMLTRNIIVTPNDTTGANIKITKISKSDNSEVPNRLEIGYEEKNVTINGIDVSTVIPSISTYSIEPSNKYLEGIFSYLKTMSVDETLSKNTLDFLQLLKNSIQSYQDFDLPPLAISSPEENEFLITWDIPHIRIGFSIESDENESSWYAITDGTIDATNAWGYLRDMVNQEKLVDFLIDYFIGISKKKINE